jgi:hypothetical protein
VEADDPPAALADRLGQQVPHQDTAQRAPLRGVGLQPNVADRARKMGAPAWPLCVTGRPAISSHLDGGTLWRYVFDLY